MDGHAGKAGRMDAGRTEIERIVEAALSARRSAITRLRAQFAPPYAAFCRGDGGDLVVGRAGLAAMDGLDGAAMAHVRAMRAYRAARSSAAPLIQ